jgi:hypothetical protein
MAHQWPPNGALTIDNPVPSTRGRAGGLEWDGDGKGWDGLGGGWGIKGAGEGRKSI